MLFVNLSRSNVIALKTNPDGNDLYPVLVSRKRTGV